jgi:hypothetical protein
VGENSTATTSLPSLGLASDGSVTAHVTLATAVVLPVPPTPPTVTMHRP